MIFTFFFRLIHFPQVQLETFVARTSFLVIPKIPKQISDFLFSVADLTRQKKILIHAQFHSIDVTMDTKTANHILITTVLTTTLAILLSAAPASINHAEVSARGIPFIVDHWRLFSSCTLKGQHLGAIDL